MQAQEQDIADGLSLCITKDGQQTVTANIPLGNNKITLLAGGTLVTDAMNLGQSRTASAQYASASGGPTGAYVAGFSPAITAVSDGMRLRVYFGQTNSTSATATFNPDALGAANIVKANGAILAQGDVKVGVGSVTRYGAAWYYSPPLAPAGAFGLTDGGVFTSGSVQANTAYMVDGSASAQLVIFPLGVATGDMVPLTIFGNNTVSLWASGLNMYGASGTIDNSGREGLANARYTGPNRGWVW